MKANTYTGNQRVFNIINRAEEEFGFEYDLQDSLLDILNDAENLLLDNIEYDRIEECLMSRSHQHLHWADGMGFDYESDGDFFGADADLLDWYRKDDNGEFECVDNCFELGTDYVSVDRVVDSEGQVVLLVAK